MPSEPLTSETTTSAPTSPAAHPPAAAERPGEPTGHPSGLAIIASKISPAVEGRLVLTRARLVGWLEQQAHARVILLTAEAGYGKSTLLNDFARRSDLACIWYRLETSDGDWITFLSYMVASLRGAVPGFGQATEALLRNVAAMGSSRELVLAQFLSDLGEVGSSELLVILDDYHLVGESADVRMIVGRLIDRAPEGMRFVLAGRGRPNLAFGRMIAQGRVAELTTQDLRFSRPEIEELFATAYLQPLDQRAREVVAERTQGWAASLQLVAASIAVSRPSEVASFIEALSGATGPIYDFLAEEVLARMAPLTERVLLHASLLDRVTPELVTAGLSVSDEPIDRDMVAAHLEDARSLGLLGEAEAESGGARIHPLFRELLEHHLGQLMPPEHIMAMHAAIARCAEGTAWLASAKHYALADMERDAMRVLGSAASEALGTGGWGAVVEVVALMPDATPPPAVEVIKARALLSHGKTSAALELLRAIDRRQLTPEERGLVGLTSATAFHLEGSMQELESEVELVARDELVPAPLRGVAVSWRQMLIANHGGSITAVVGLLSELARRQLQSGLRYFAGITLHNTANAELARGNYDEARRLAAEAVVQLSQVEDGAGVIASSRSIAAVAAAERGHLTDGLREATAAATEPGATADAIAEAAYINALCGRLQRAESLLAKFDRGDAPWSKELASRAQACHGRVALRLCEGDLRGARLAWDEILGIEASDLDAVSRGALVDSVLALLEGADGALELARDAIAKAASQDAWRWIARARILEAAAERDGRKLALWIGEAERESTLALLELADVIATVIDLLSPVPEALERSITQAPARWLPVLRRQLSEGESASAGAAASLVAKFGTLEDASLLRALNLDGRGKARRRGHVAKLIRRVSPTVRLHDLGPTSYEIGDREVVLTETRRSGAMLMLYLATRSRLIAARDQVLESLWPDQTPKSAINSLHQTLFHLRRDIEPWYDEGCTAAYVRMESDMVFLDAEMFQIDSVAFNRQVADILKTGTARDRGPEMLRLYRGRFAPEFEYEEWAEAWRTLLHGAYLHLAHSTTSALVREGRYSETIEILLPVMLVDPLALDLRGTLIACFAAMGSNDAALAHYRSLAQLHMRDLGVPAPTYDEIVARLGQ